MPFAARIDIPCTTLDFPGDVPNCSVEYFLDKKASIFRQKIERGVVAPLSFCTIELWLLPVTLDEHIAAVTVFPAVGDPNRTRVRGMRPVAMMPDIAVAIPAMVPINPHPSRMRRMIVNFNDWFRRRNADIDLRHCNRGQQANRQQQRESCFFHA